MENSSIIYANMARVPNWFHKTADYAFRLNNFNSTMNDITNKIYDDPAWMKQEMKADGIMPDTMFVTYPNDTCLTGTHIYIKWDSNRNSHYMFQKIINN